MRPAGSGAASRFTDVRDGESLRLELRSELRFTDVWDGESLRLELRSELRSEYDLPAPEDETGAGDMGSVLTSNENLKPSVLWLGWMDCEAVRSSLSPDFVECFFFCWSLLLGGPCRLGLGGPDRLGLTGREVEWLDLEVFSCLS